MLAPQTLSSTLRNSFGETAGSADPNVRGGVKAVFGPKMFMGVTPHPRSGRVHSSGRIKKEIVGDDTEAPKGGPL